MVHIAWLEAMNLCYLVSFVSCGVFPSDSNGEEVYGYPLISFKPDTPFFLLSPLYINVQ